MLVCIIASPMKTFQTVSTRGLQPPSYPTEAGRVCMIPGSRLGLAMIWNRFFKNLSSAVLVFLEAAQRVIREVSISQS